MKNLLIAIPTAKYIEPETFKSIYDLEIPEGYEVTFEIFKDDNIAQIRNFIADWTIKGYDYLFSVDSDITFPPDTLKKLLSHDKDIITGVYRQRVDNVLELYDINQHRLSENSRSTLGTQVFEIGGCGFGCVLVKSEVFRTIGYPQFEYHSALDHAHTFSEDNDFCKKARDRGYKLWVDPTVLCGHIGSTTLFVD